MSGNLVPAFKYASVAATVLKWFTGIVAPVTLNVRYISVHVSTAEANDTMTFSDEDGANVFLVIPLDTVGLFTYFYPAGLISMPVGHDIKVVHSGTSGVAKTTIGVEMWS